MVISLTCHPGRGLQPEWRHLLSSTGNQLRALIYLTVRFRCVILSEDVADFATPGIKEPTLPLPEVIAFSRRGTASSLEPQTA